MWGRTKVIAALLLLVACSEEKGFYPASFSETKEATVELIGDEMLVKLPIDMCVMGKYVCVLAYTPKYWLHMYDKETGAFASDALPVGRGPGDALNAMSMDYDRDSGLLYVNDPDLNKSVRYRFVPESSELIYVDEVRHPHMGVIRQYHLLNDGRFLYEGYLPDEDKNTRFFLYEDGEITARYLEYPGIKEESDKFSFLLSNGKSDPETGKFVFGTLYGAVLECFDLSGDVFDRTGLRKLDPPSMDISSGEIRMKKGSKWGFSTFFPTADRIYTVYVDSEDATVFNSICTFGWDGKEQVRYEAGCNILRIAEDSANTDVLYGIVSGPQQQFQIARIGLN